MLRLKNMWQFSLPVVFLLVFLASLEGAAGGGAEARVGTTGEVPIPSLAQQEKEWQEKLSLTLPELNERGKQSSLLIAESTSSCSLEHGCPHASMAWATGTFTLSDVLTPSSFLVASNLTLKMSLCCGYKYNGSMLRDTALYDVFLQALLQATPFQILTLEEKRRMFPLSRVIIFDTLRDRRYDAAYVPTVEDVQVGNDGDGDVIVLVSGAVGDGIHRVPLQHPAGSRVTEGMADIQLKVANMAIKCKCPHTLRVMPILRAQSDTLPPVSILGLGSHCGMQGALPHFNKDATGNNKINNDSNSNILRLHNGVWAVSFALSPPLLPATLVQWVVRDVTRGAAAAVVVLDESFHIKTETGIDGNLLLRQSHASSSYFEMTPHHRYEVRVTVSRGIVTQTDSGTFVMHLPLGRHREVEHVAPKLHFGFERKLRLSKGTINDAELRDALTESQTESRAKYVGYWVNTPSNDQPLPQRQHRVQHNPYTEDSVTYPLFVGQNIISFYVNDIDEVCDPTLLEVQEFWALQSILLHPSTSPMTACKEDISVEALTLSGVVAAMRSLHQLPVRFPPLPRDAREKRDVIEGRFKCAGHAGEPCHIHVEEGANGGASGVLKMRRRSVVEVSWVLRVEVKNTAFMMHEENFDPAVARVVAQVDEPFVLVEVHSRAALVVRRMSTLPERVRITLPMHKSRLLVYPPRQVEDEGALLFGRWIAAEPLRVVSVNDAFTLELDTTLVPNVEQTLEEGTLRFIAEDCGEATSDPLLVGVSYTSKCPPRIVEHMVVVVAVHAPPISPALLPVYTEERCVQLQAPRAARKDEDALWHIPHCAEAASRPYIVSEQQQQEWRNDAVDRTSTAEVIMVCGIEVQQWCDVVWSAQNPVGTVMQTFSLRRCQRSPNLVFHQDGQQQPRGEPSSAYTFPLVEWLVDEYGLTKGDSGASAAGENRFIALRIIPIAGHKATIGYSFNYTKSQDHFEAEFTYTGAAAHQLQGTQKHFQRVRGKYAGDSYSTDEDEAALSPPLLIRRFVSPLDGKKDNEASITADSGEIDDTITVWSRGVYNSDYDIDIEYDARFSMLNNSASRQLQFHGLSNSSHYPLLYVIRPLSKLTAPSPAHAEAAAEFAKRGMCLERSGAISVLSLTPLGLVQVIGEREVLFCESTFVFSRHPWLNTKYHFDFTWSCADKSVIAVVKHTPTLSVLHHGGGDVNATHCTLSVHNTLTDTTQTDMFLLRRVYPTALSPTFAVLSDNAATGGCVSKSKAHLTGVNKVTANAPATAARKLTTKHWVVGSSAVLHVDTPTKGGAFFWRAVSVVTVDSTFIGTQLLLDSIEFVPLVEYPRALHRGPGGTTVMVKGIHEPGLYTLTHYHFDPGYPGICPNISVTETLHVARARVVEKELTVFGDVATLSAVPLPREIECQFIGRWEVVSLQTSANEIWGFGSNFTGILFDNVSKPHTQVKGLVFGIVTIRWAIYAVASSMYEDGIHKRSDSTFVGGFTSKDKQEELVLVDFDTLQVLVLTENLRSNRLVTLSDAVDILPTSSTLNWGLIDTQSGGASGFLLSSGPSIRVDVVPNEGDGSGIVSVTRNVIVVENLPIGVTHLEYELHASPHMFGPMLRKRFPFAQRHRFEIERVSAFLSVNTTLDHECDAYSGHGKISFCLHTNDITFSASAASEKLHSPVGVHLVVPEVLEGIVKAGAERVATDGCSVPWWVTSKARWFDIHTDVSQRCVSFSVSSVQHLQPKEVSHYLFLSQERMESSRLCAHNHGDFMTSEIIEGAETWSESTQAHEPFFRSGNSKRGGIVKFLPFRDPTTLASDERVMRPMFGLLGVPDVVATELDISEVASSNTKKTAVEVVLRLDTGSPKQMGGYPHATASKQQQQQEEEQHVLQRGSLLEKCVRDTVRGSDILRHWTEVNRPDRAEGLAAHEWLEYVEESLDAYVPCEPLFPSLAHLLPRLDDTEESLRNRLANRMSSTERPLVSLDVIAQQLDGLRQEFRWTHDGINVTGLRTDLQEALSRRRITTSQLEEISRARVDKGGSQEKLKQRLSLSHGPEGTSREELFETVMRLYRGVTEEDVSAIRVTLPRYVRFTAPHNLFLRTALHKDVLCGTRIPTSAASLVFFGRVELLDVPPVVSISPPAIKQCEVEGGLPVIDISLSGTRLVNLSSFPTDRILLEEVHNPNRTAFGLAAAESSPDVGLLPCLKQMQAGMVVKMSRTTRKHLHVQLSPCPSFQMLSPAEYDEHQDSTMLQLKLQLPRLLRVTLREVLVEDSHVHGKTSMSFVVEVRPTLARLHLRTLSSSENKFGPWSTASRNRPLLVCESDVQRKGVEFGVELIGDIWHDDVGSGGGWDGEEITTSSLPPSGASHGFEAVDTAGLQQWGLSDDAHATGFIHWSPQNVALLNSFSIVEHHGLDSVHHIFLQHGGLYRSHFVSYLFSTLLANPDNIRQHQLVWRYNSTFVGIRIPAGVLHSKDSGAGTGSNNNNKERGFSYGYTEEDLPPIRPFAAIEEILFAVPGISTECRGCLLADTTYFVAGDLTGLWSFPPTTLPPLENSVLTEPLRVPFYETLRVPREWRFTTMCPTAAWDNLNRLWRRWESPPAASNSKPFLQMEVVLYSLRNMLGEEVPLSKRPTVLLTSVPISVADLMQKGQTKAMDSLSEIVFHVETSAAERAHAMIAADFVRYGRRHLHTMHNYVRDDRGSGGALTVNASVFLKFCVHATSSVTQQQQKQHDSQCTIMSLTHSLLIVEEPRTASYRGRLRRGSWGSIFHPVALLHHAGTALLGYFIFPRVLWVRQNHLSPHMRDVMPARGGTTVMLFVAAVFLYQMMSWLWAVLWVLLWGALFCLLPEMIVGLYFLLHLLWWAFVM